MPKPDLYVYLHSNTDTLLKNIRKRGRSFEQDIKVAYLEKIQKEYFQFFKQISTFPILIIDINNIDFVNNSEHFDQIKAFVFKSHYKLGINKLIM
jgi:deoxyguanosine kinase